MVNQITVLQKTGDMSWNLPQEFVYQPGAHLSFTITITNLAASLRTFCVWLAGFQSLEAGQSAFFMVEVTNPQLGQPAPVTGHLSYFSVESGASLEVPVEEVFDRTDFYLAGMLNDVELGTVSSVDAHLTSPPMWMQLLQTVPPLVVLGGLVGTVMVTALSRREGGPSPLPQGVASNPIPWEKKMRLTSDYGRWAVGMAEGLCPHGDVACVEREAKRFYETRRFREER